MERLREYYTLRRPTDKSEGEEKSLMLVQIELRKRYDNDLLACVRHLTVEIQKELGSSHNANPSAFVAVIVIVPRENVRNVSGFQLGNI